MLDNTHVTLMCTQINCN